MPYAPLIIRGKGHVRRAVIEFVPSLQNDQENFKITQYKLYRQSDDGSEWTPILSMAAKKGYQSNISLIAEVRKISADDQTCIYALSSIDNRGRESPLSDPITIRTIKRPTLSLAKDPLLREIHFTWAPVKAINGYNLYRRYEQNEWKKIGQISGASKISLNRFALAVSSTLDLQDILRAICKEMVERFNARNTGIGLMNADRSKITLAAFYTASPDEKDATGLEIPLEGNASTHFVIETGQTIVVPDVQNNPITTSIHDVFTERGTQCVMIVPLLARGEIIGTIGLPMSDPERIFTPVEVSLAQTIACQIASAIDNARLHEQTQKAKEIAERDLEIGRQIQTGFLPETLPAPPGWQIASHFQAARQVAGDFYDAFELPGGNIGIVIGDVCDKGVGSALFMALFRSLIRVFSGQMCLHGLPVVKHDDKVSIEVDPQVTCKMGQLNALKAVALTNDYIAKQRLISLVEQKSYTASGILKGIKDKLLVHVKDAKQTDDITMIAVQRLVDV